MNVLPLDHLALRVKDRKLAATFLSYLGYTAKAEFELTLEDGSKAESYALSHPKSVEVFVSSGPPGSLIDDWVNARGGMGAVHHLAYAVEDVAAVMEEWKGRGIQFCTDAPLVCPCESPLTQVFTKPDPSTGIIYELINRGDHLGFCPDNVKRLMASSTR